MTLRFRILGPLTVSIDGRPVEITRAKQRSLLAALILNRGEVISRDQLIEDLWQGKPPTKASGSLQNLVSELRKLLGAELVKTRAPGYMLEIADGCVDSHVFEQQLAEAHATSDARRRIAILKRAIGLWRGPPLADFAYESFARADIRRLNELRVGAQENLIDAELELGRHTLLIGELTSLVARHPGRERLLTQLMLALYRDGRQLEALDAYSRAREELLDEFGLEPGPQLRRLQRAILRHDPELERNRAVRQRRGEQTRLWPAYAEDGLAEPARLASA